MDLSSLTSHPLTDRAERALKTALRVVSAVNQSQARVVLDPIYETTADLLLRNVPLSPELSKKTFEDNLFFWYRDTAHKVAYSIDGWDWSQARPELLTERQKAFLTGSTIGETSGFAVGAGFLHTFRNDPELGSFFGVWFTEELNHYWGYHRYMEKLGRGFTRERKEEVTGIDFRSYTDDAMEMAAANLYQELIAYLIYRSYAKQVRDPFLSNMVMTFAKDELRHYKFYEAVCARHIQKHPGFRKYVLKHFFKATTPVNQVAGGISNTLGYLSTAAFYFRKPEFDFLIRQAKYLLGDGFEELFAFFYRRHLPACALCGEEVFRCACENFDVEGAPARAAA